jgi:Tfp pilus assembly protein PilN
MSIDRVSRVAILLIGPYLAQSRESLPGAPEEESIVKLSRIHQLIHRRFEADHNDYALSTLKQLEEQPDNPDPQEALAAMVSQKRRDDLGFAQELADQVNDAVQDEAIRQVVDRFYTPGSSARDHIDRLHSSG